MQRTASTRRVRVPFAHVVAVCGSLLLAGLGGNFVRGEGPAAPVDWVGLRDNSSGGNFVRGEGAAAPSSFAPTTVPTTQPDFHVDLRQAVTYLASDELEGRYVGTPGIEKAGQYVAESFAKLGLQPPPGQADYFQPFTMTTGVKLDEGTTFAASGKDWPKDVKFTAGKTYTPMTISGEGSFDGPVAFAGYGVVREGQFWRKNPFRGGSSVTTWLRYDDYAGLDVKGKVVLVLRYEPHKASGKSQFTGRREDWSPAASLMQKAKEAADRGATALLVVTPPNLHPDETSLSPFARMFHSERASIPVVQVMPEIANALLKAADAPELAELQGDIDDAGKPKSLALAGVSVKGAVALKKETKDVRNVVAVLPGRGQQADEYVVIGSHYDHLGRGGPGSLAPLSKAIHHGADDNASGTTAMLKLADHYAHAGPPPRTLVFVAFTAEEEGLIGSQYFVNHSPVPLEKVVAMLNLDMVGRVRDGKLSVGGTGTAASFDKILAVADEGSPLKLQNFGKGGLGPSDHTSFATKRVPVLFFFSGLHLDYHRPSDTADKINYDGMQQVVDLGVRVVDAFATMPREQYVGTFDSGGQMAMGSGAGTGSASGGSRVTLGVVPDYSDETIKGVRISGTTPGSPADKAGLQAGDTIVGYNDAKLTGLMDLFQSLQKGKPGDKVRLKVLRDGKEVESDAILVERKG